MEAASALTVRSTSQCRAVSAPAAHVYGRQQRAVLVRTRRCWLRALPPELSEVLSPKLVPGSPSDTGDVLSLIPVSAVMLLFYFVSNWVVPELLMKRLQQDDDDAAAASVSSATQQGDAAGDDKIRMKVKKNKKKKSTKV